MASKSSTFGDLVYEVLTGSEKKELKSEKRKALLEQQNNIEEYKKKLGSYRAKMGAQGVGGISSGVQDGLRQQTDYANSLITQEINKKIKENKNKTRRRTLLSLGIKTSAG